VKQLTSALLSLLLVSCVSVPDGIEPVRDFSVERYLGTWYEIARLDHKFERGLSHVAAEYTLMDEGGLKVKNTGYSAADDRWQEAEGKAYFVEDATTGYLKVSFQWPFYSSYVVFKLDDNYEYAYVTGNDRDYLWLLSRTPQVDADVLADFKSTAEAKGFNLDDLIMVNQIPLD
jgi:apolipoprotein D and lipocalin family protein